MIKEIMKGVIYGLTTLIIFITALFFPPAGIFIPVFKINKAKDMSLMSKIVGNLVPIILIGTLEITLLLIYAVFLVVEIMYVYNKKITNKLGTFDKIAINSFVTGILLLIISYIVIEKSGITMLKLEEIYADRSGVKIEDLKGAFEYLKENIYIITFAYMYMVNYLVFWIEDRDGYKEWKISYLWIALYVIIFFINYFIKEDSIYLENILNILKNIVMFFGIKELYIWLKPKIKSSFLAKVLVVLAFLISPMVIFVFGGIKIFETKK
ncbi:MAG: hypothetical protein ACRC6U_11020 [Fusobacteriaceae bacterium]